MITHEFTSIILSILEKYFPKRSKDILEKSSLLQYLNIKTRSANKGSKSRGSFANHYALYVLVEDYIKNGFHEKTAYSKYAGAVFSDLYTRQRELPFGAKLQNHALNHRLNEEFKKYFPSIELLPIIRDAATNRYWVNEKLLKIKLADQQIINLAKPIIDIIDAYVVTKRGSFEAFIADCKKIKNIPKEKNEEAVKFILDLIRPNVDARIFEIVTYSILKESYSEQQIFWGFDQDNLNEEKLKLFKTGRTNANDGGIDFVMKPLGRFFQVTETLDVKKYFLDIDKVERFPITFVVKSEDSVENIMKTIKAQAEKLFDIESVVTRYMGCIEEIINIPSLTKHLDLVISKGKLSLVIDEILRQSLVEFNYEEDSDDDSD